MDNKPFCFAGLGELFQEFQQFQLLFYGFFRLFRCGQGAVLEISAVSATFLEIFPAISLWLGELFQKFQRFQLLFSRIFPVFGLDWGAVLEVLWITATQGLSAINIWLLYTMLIQCGDIMLKNKNDGSYWISAVKLLKNFALKETILKCEVFYIIIQLQPWQISFYHV